jgi:hypothetical protein
MFELVEFMKLHYFCLNSQKGNGKLINGFRNFQFIHWIIFVFVTCLVIAISIYFHASFRDIYFCAGISIPLIGSQSRINNTSIQDT